MRNILAVFKKQCKETLKNKEVLIQFLLFPVMGIIMENMIQIQGMPDNFFVNLFAVMYIGMAPLTAMSAILSEEKQYNTLRVLLMSNVKPWEYLLGVGGYIWLICMLGSGVFCVVGKYQGREALMFLLIMAAGVLTSTLIGAAVGTWSKNQMMATSIAVPVMMVFAFLPMLAMFNESIAKVARFAYSEQISRMIGQIQTLTISVENIVTVSVNVLLALILFIVAYRKSGLA